MKVFFKKHYTKVLIALSIALSYTGFVFYSIALDESINILDISYNVIKLFLIDADMEKEGMNIFLEIARFLAPASLATALISGIQTLFSNKIQKERARRFKGHVIFCGNNVNLTPLMNEQKALGNSYVHICDENSPEENGSGYPREVRYSFSEFDEEGLRNTAFYQCRHIVISNSSDLQSIEYACSLINVLDTAKLSSPIEIILVFNQPKWAELSNDLKLLENINNKILENPHLNIRYINYIDRRIRELLIRFSPDTFRPVLTPAGESPQILVTGFSEIAQRLILGLAMNCHYINHKKATVHLLTDKEEQVRRFAADYQLQMSLRIEIHESIEQAESFQQADVIYFCEEDNVKLLQRVGTVTRIKALENARKIICFRSKIDHVKFGNRIDEVFEAMGETNTYEALIDQSVDEKARDLHKSYLGNLEKRDPAKETHREWHNLPDAIKDNNRYAADHISVKIRSMGCEEVPLSHPAEAFEIKNYEYLEELCKAEHNRWCAYMYCRGWKQGERRDDELKVQPNLVPYEQLTEEFKQYDLNQILEISKALEHQGRKIIRVNGNEKKEVRTS